jgi:hypothetical protein
LDGSAYPKRDCGTWPCAVEPPDVAQGRDDRSGRVTTCTSYWRAAAMSDALTNS